MKLAPACMILAAVLAAASPAAAQNTQAPSATRDFLPNPRSVNPSPVRSTGPVKRKPSNHDQHRQNSGYGSNAYNQPYVNINIDSATMNRLLATPAPQPTHRAAPHPTPTVFWQINNRQ